jgi:hypothetical protein
LLSRLARRAKSGGGPPQSKTLARYPMIPEMREAYWTAPASWRFGLSAEKWETAGKVECGV